MRERKTQVVEELTLQGPSALTAALNRPLEARYSRDLTEADHAALDLPKGTQPASLVRIHSSHHALAKCLATGVRPMHAALITGYSPGRISQLARDPTFKALVAEYEAEAQSAVADIALRMRGLSVDAIELLHDRLLEKPEDFSVGMLLDIVKGMADRTGHGPGQSMTHNFNMPTIDRPPREDYEDWKARRTRELELKPLEQLEPPTRSTN